MEHDQLARLLEQEGTAFAACRTAVLASARFWVADASQPASSLASTYKRRERHTRQRGIPTIGFADAIAVLSAQGEGLVTLGAVDQDEPPYHFQLFLNEDATAVLACLGVDQSWQATQAN